MTFERLSTEAIYMSITPLDLRRRYQSNQTVRLSHILRSPKGKSLPQLLTFLAQGGAVEWDIEACPGVDGTDFYIGQSTERSYGDVHYSDLTTPRSDDLPYDMPHVGRCEKCGGDGFIIIKEDEEEKEDKGEAPTSLEEAIKEKKEKEREDLPKSLQDHPYNLIVNFCFGCGFAHVDDYIDCTWNKEI